MELNHETAMRLWNKQFGKSNEVFDYAGRKIMKGAYNQRNSQFGWNVDHIFPESKGGKTTDANLICCHILTNDEKANKFPSFVANGKRFNAVRVENHYEIQPVNEDSNGNQNVSKESATEDEVNLFDSAAGIRLFEHLKGIQNKPRWVGTVTIRIKKVASTAVTGFIEEVFKSEDISYASSEYLTVITARNYDMSSPAEAEELLERCILLNTYLGHYFLPLNYLDSYQIHFDMECYENRNEMYKREYLKDHAKYVPDYFNASYMIKLPNALSINGLVYLNTDAKKNMPNVSIADTQDVPYDYCYTNLAKNLDKEVNGD
jgi:hypothetical protein